MQHLTAYSYSLVFPTLQELPRVDPNATRIGDCMTDLMNEFAYSEFVCAIECTTSLVYKIMILVLSYGMPPSTDPPPPKELSHAIHVLVSCEKILC